MPRFFKGLLAFARGNRPMKICILSYYDLMRRNTGGSVRTYHLAENLAAQGHEVIVIIPGGNETFELTNRILVKRMNGMLPYSLLRFFSILLGVSRVTSLYLYDLSFFLRAFSTVSESNIVQIDVPVPAGAFIAFLLAKFFRKPVVVDSHDTFQALRIEYSNVLRRVLELSMEKIAYRCAKLVLTVSEMDKRLLVRYGIRRSKIVVIPNGVDPTTFTPTANAHDIKNRYNLKNFFIVVFVGNMEYLPNREAVNLIATKLAPEILSKIRNVRFLMVGRKPPELPSTTSLIFTGIVNNVAHLLAASDVAVAPLLHGSGTRLKILEYLSCGLPVVSTSVGIEGLKIEKGVNVLIEDDMERFSMRVIELLQDKKLRKSLGDSGRELVVKEYDWREIGKKLSANYGLMTKELR